jgi:thiamine-monophosphate kinase
VTGTLGDAAGALTQWRRGGPRSAKLRYRLDRPAPRMAEALALRRLATAAIDLSDGLAADLGHLVDASSVGAQIDLGRLPTSRILADHFADEHERWRLQLSGGDDYELCFTAPASNALAIEQALAASDTLATVIGSVTAELALTFATPEGETFDPRASGYDHFAGDHA